MTTSTLIHWKHRLLTSCGVLACGTVISLLGPSCGGSGEDALKPPCESVYAEYCGQSCTYDTDCHAGLYCSANQTCTADCAPGAAQCKTGQVCDANGRCGNGGDGGAGGVVSGSGGAGGNGCPDVNVTFEKQTPTVMLLVDQSGSMTSAFGGTDRWNALYQTLMDPNNGVVRNLEGEVRFGLTLYTGDSNGDGSCPDLVKVPIALNNYASIDGIYAGQGPLGETPTGESIDAVTVDLVNFAEPGPKIIVLATDGEPDTCAVPNPQNGQPEAIAAAQNAFAQGIQTFIISVGSQVGEPHLQDMANAGVGNPVQNPPMNAPYYIALNQQALIDAFTTIINGVRSCAITLNGSVAPEDANKGVVTLDGQVLPYNDPNGWTFTPPDTVTLQGTACDTIQMGTHNLEVTFPCGTVIPE